MFTIRNIPEQKNFVDIKHVTVTADFVTELAHSMLKSFTPQTGMTIEKENIFVKYYISVHIFVAKCRDLHVINVK